MLFRRQLFLPGLAKYQPYIFGIGMMVFSLVMMGAGTLGVQRRHWDMAFTDAAIGFDYPASAFTLMGLLGVSGVAAVVGGHAAAGKWGFAAPGTFALAIFFLAIFVIYYAVNWKYLASVWPMS